MTSYWASPFVLWLADIYLVSSLLLGLTLAPFAVLRQPAADDTGARGGPGLGRVGDPYCCPWLAAAVLAHELAAGRSDPRVTAAAVLGADCRRRC